jgi:DNA polymerase I-like protein with 3'-5' exonuclease and polymerase domains
MFVFDIESDGLLIGEDVLTKLHCINAIDRRTGQEYRFTDHEYYQDEEGNTTDVPCPRDGSITTGLDKMAQQECLAGHNIIGYDLPAIRLLYTESDEQIPDQKRYDSAVAGKCLYPNLKDKDWANKRKGKLPDNFYAGDNSLRGWALRAGGALKKDFNPKDYGHTWRTMPFTKDMDDYCMDDVRANVSVIEMQEQAAGYSQAALDLEFAVAEIIKLQETTGVRFDVEAANKFAGELYTRLHELEGEARNAFPPCYVKDGAAKTFKKNMRRKNKHNDCFEYIEAGVTVQPVKLIDFNPGSRPQIEARLRAKYDWEPTEFTDKGRAKIDEEVLKALPFPETQTIGDYMMVQKRLSQLAEGKTAWIKSVREDTGRIHGRVDQLGTGTGRMSHFGPNLSAVPKNESPYGTECRSLFIADEDRVLLGMDADALELRVLAHFLARFDGGRYVKIVLEGNSKDKTDMHSRNQSAIQLRLRDSAKTFFYAWLYGSGNFNLGTIHLADFTAEKLAQFYKAFPPGEKRRRKIAALGKRGRDRMVAGIPGIQRLLDAVEKAAERGYILGLDKRRIPVRSKHSILNFLCQGSGALVMKRALVIAFAAYREAGMDVLPLLNVHDEFQLSVTLEESENAGAIAADAVRQAGEYYGFRCPLAGNYDVGSNWSETH